MSTEESLTDLPTPNLLKKSIESAKNYYFTGGHLQHF